MFPTDLTSTVNTMLANAVKKQQEKDDSHTCEPSGPSVPQEQLPTGLNGEFYNSAVQTRRGRTIGTENQGQEESAKPRETRSKSRPRPRSFSPGTELRKRSLFSKRFHEEPADSKEEKIFNITDIKEEANSPSNNVAKNLFGKKMSTPAPVKTEEFHLHGDSSVGPSAVSSDWERVPGQSDLFSTNKSNTFSEPTELPHSSSSCSAAKKPSLSGLPKDQANFGSGGASPRLLPPGGGSLFKDPPATGGALNSYPPHKVHKSQDDSDDYESEDDERHQKLLEDNIKLASNKDDLELALRQQSKDNDETVEKLREEIRKLNVAQVSSAAQGSSVDYDRAAEKLQRKHQDELDAVWQQVREKELETVKLNSVLISSQRERDGERHNAETARRMYQNLLKHPVSGSSGASNGFTSLSQYPATRTKVICDAIVGSGSNDDTRRAISDVKWLQDRIKTFQTIKIPFTKYTFNSSERVEERIAKWFTYRTKWINEVLAVAGDGVEPLIRAEFDEAMYQSRYFWKLSVREMPSYRPLKLITEYDGGWQSILQHRLGLNFRNSAMPTSHVEKWDSRVKDEEDEVVVHGFNKGSGIFHYCLINFVFDGSPEQARQLYSDIQQPRFVGKKMFPELIEWLRTLRRVGKLLNDLHMPAPDVVNILVDIIDQNVHPIFRLRVENILEELGSTMIGSAIHTGNMQMFYQRFDDIKLLAEKYKVSDVSFTPPSYLKRESSSAAALPQARKAGTDNSNKNVSDKTDRNGSSTINVPSGPCEYSEWNPKGGLSSFSNYSQFCIPCDGKRSSHMLSQVIRFWADPCKDHMNGWKPGHEGCLKGKNCKFAHMNILPRNLADPNGLMCWNTGCTGHSIKNCTCNIPADNKMQSRNAQKNGKKRSKDKEKVKARKAEAANDAQSKNGEE